MKKVTLIAAAICAAMGVHAQVSFGIQAGVNFATTQVEIYNTSASATRELDTKSRTGFAGGFLADVPISTTFSFMPELNFVQKGYEYESTSGAIVSKAKDKLNFIEIPLNIVYKAEVGMGHVFVGLGPSVGFGISGKNERSLSGAGNGFDFNEKRDVKFDGDENASDNKLHLKTLDLGGNAVGGYMLSNGLFLKVGYTYGFSNLSPDFASPRDDEKYNTRGFSVKLGYMFGGNSASE
jgi:hypothetical protein